MLVTDFQVLTKREREQPPAAKRTKVANIRRRVTSLNFWYGTVILHGVRS
jgi:hypothetical protein